MCQFPLIDITSDYDFMLELFEHLADEDLELETLDLISGYLNPPGELMELLQDIKSKNTTIIGASPEVINSTKLTLLYRPTAFTTPDSPKI